MAGARPIITASATISPSADAEVVLHARLVDDEPAEHELRLLQRARRQHEALGDGDPLGMPRPRCALEVLHHRIDHQPGVLAHRLGGGKHQLAEEIGLRFCGIVLDAPRPLTKGS